MPRPAMIEEHGARGVRYFRFESIPAERVTHGLFTRHGGVSPPPFESLNFSRTVGDDPANVRANFEIAARVLGLDPDRRVAARMRHTTRVLALDEGACGVPLPDADGAVTGTPGLVLWNSHADCQLLLLYDPEHHVLGLAHAGWPGTLGGIALALVRAMAQFGSRPEALLAGLGPVIGACCYEVGEEVAARARSWPGGETWLVPGRAERPHLDLAAANEALLRRAGVERIEQAALCTACRTDLFFSYRAEKPLTGRLALLAALREPPQPAAAPGVESL